MFTEHTLFNNDDIELLELLSSLHDLINLKTVKLDNNVIHITYIYRIDFKLIQIMLDDMLAYQDFILDDLDSDDMLKLTIF